MAMAGDAAAAAVDRRAKEDEEESKRHGTEAQIKAIEEEIRTTQALTSSLFPISDLVRIYDSGGEGGGVGEGGNGASFLRGAEYLSSTYRHMRRIRGDGNCYYRAFLYSLCESVLRGLLAGEEGAREELGRLQSLAKNSLDEVTKRGYDRHAIEMFHEELVDLFDFLATASDTGGNPSSSEKCSPETLHAKLTEENATSEYCTWYLRVLTAAYLKSDPDRFVHFLDEPYFDVPTFCSREVEPMGRECGMVQVLALAEAMGVKVEIEYLDGREVAGKDGEGKGGGKLTRHEFGPGGAGMVLSLLYRPGHYDILYKD